MDGVQIPDRSANHWIRQLQGMQLHNLHFRKPEGVAVPRLKKEDGGVRVVRCSSISKKPSQTSS